MGYQPVQVSEPFITTDNDEDDKSPSQVTIDENGARATRTVRVAWDQAAYFCAEVTPYVCTIGDSVCYKQGQLYPHDKTYMKMRAVSATIRPFGGSSAALIHADGDRSKLITHEEALVDIQYQSIRSGISGLVEESFDPSVEYMTISNRKLYWDAGKTDELKTDEAPGVMVAGAAWIYTIKMWPYLPIAFLLTYQGHTNSVAMESQRYGITFPARTVLYISPQIIETVNHLGLPEYRLTFQMIVKNSEWNKFFKASEITPRIIYGESGQVEPYPEADLRQFILTG